MGMTEYQSVLFTDCVGVAFRHPFSRKTLSAPTRDIKINLQGSMPTAYQNNTQRRGLSF